MKPTSNRRPQRIAILLIAALWLMAFSLACRLAPAHISSTGQVAPSLAQTLFGDTRMAIGSRLYTQADVYFHRGVPHEQERAFGNDIFQRLREQVSPTEHDHLEGANDIREIMPWLDLATRANPEDSASYLVAAFWLSSAAGRHDLALTVLDRAQCNIPYAYDIQLAKGRLFLHTGRYTPAHQAFDAALAYWEKSADPTRDDHLLDKAEALLYRALLQEIDGEIDAAISDLREMLRISPDRPALQARLQQLESGTPGQPSAQDLLRTMMRQADERRHSCEHEECEEDHT
jgi:tetratricopeptide (TPR) repeat protein